MTLPLATIERLMKQVGKIRVGADGAGEMQAILDKKLASVTEKAAVLAKHAGRKTIKAEDVRLANDERLCHSTNDVPNSPTSISASAEMVSRNCKAVSRSEFAEQL